MRDFPMFDRSTSCSRRRGQGECLRMLFTYTQPVVETKGYHGLTVWFPSKWVLFMELHIPPWEKENHLQISFGRGYVSYQNQLAFNIPHLLARSAGNSRFFGMKSHHQLLCDVCQYRAARRIFQIATYHLMNSWRRFFVCCRCKEFEGLTGGKKKTKERQIHVTLS